MSGARNVSYKSARFRFACSNYISSFYHYEPHAHEWHELVLVQRGRLRVQIEDSQQFVGPNDIALYPAGTVHEEWAEDGAPVLTWVCAFNWAGFDKAAALFCHDAHDRVQVLLACLVSEHYAHMPWPKEREYGDPLLQAVLAELDRLTAREPQAIVELVRAFIRDNIREPFTLGDLAQISGISKTHLARLFSSVTGRTPMEDARFLRVEEARKLILSTNLPLSEIAPMVGIANEHYLSRLLKSLLNVGVRDLRRPTNIPE